MIFLSYYYVTKLQNYNFILFNVFRRVHVFCNVQQTSVRDGKIDRADRTERMVFIVSIPDYNIRYTFAHIRS